MSRPRNRPDRAAVPVARVEVLDDVAGVDIGQEETDDTTEASPPPGAERGNYISEWFGHRVYPTVRVTDQSRADQRAGRCPFLTAVKGADTPCIKPDSAKGVCTVSSASNRREGATVRQDWLVCEYRAFDPVLLRAVAARLYAERDPDRLALFGAVTTSRPEVQTEIQRLLATGERRVLVYFDEKVGGEIKISASDDTPSLSFDVTLVELLDGGAGAAPAFGRYAVLELQTMDYHGTYAHAVNLLVHARDKAFRNDFPEQFARRPDWLAEGISTPNIANVFKRTIHQMLFKFPLGTDEACAGTALAVPLAVWDSWQRFLARPALADVGDGTLRLPAPPLQASADDATGKVPAWIVVFDFDAAANATPSPIRITHVIGTSAAALAHHAYVAAPAGVSRAFAAGQGVQHALKGRLATYWPVFLPPPTPRRGRRQ